MKFHLKLMFSVVLWFSEKHTVIRLPSCAYYKIMIRLFLKSWGRLINLISGQVCFHKVSNSTLNHTWFKFNLSNLFRKCYISSSVSRDIAGCIVQISLLIEMNKRCWVRKFIRTFQDDQKYDKEITMHKLKKIWNPRKKALLEISLPQIQLLIRSNMLFSFGAWNRK